MKVNGNSEIIEDENSLDFNALFQTAEQDRKNQRLESVAITKLLSALVDPKKKNNRRFWHDFVLSDEFLQEQLNGDFLELIVHSLTQQTETPLQELPRNMYVFLLIAFNGVTDEHKAESVEHLAPLIALMKKHPYYERIEKQARRKEFDLIRKSFTLYHDVLQKYQETDPYSLNHDEWRSLINRLECNVYTRWAPETYALLAFFVRSHPEIPHEICAIMHAVFELEGYEQSSRKQALKPLYEALGPYYEGLDAYRTLQESKLAEQEQIVAAKQQFFSDFNAIFLEYKDVDKMTRYRLDSLKEADDLLTSEAFLNIQFDNNVIADFVCYFTIYDELMVRGLFNAVYLAYQPHRDRDSVSMLLSIMDSYHDRYDNYHDNNISDNIRSIDNINNIERIESIENIDYVENDKSVEDIDNAENIEDVENIERVEPIEYIQNTEVKAIENIEDSVTPEVISKAQSDKLQKLKTKIHAIEDVKTKATGFFKKLLTDVDRQISSSQPLQQLFHKFEVLTGAQQIKRPLPESEALTTLTNALSDPNKRDCKEFWREFILSDEFLQEHFRNDFLDDLVYTLEQTFETSLDTLPPTMYTFLHIAFDPNPDEYVLYRYPAGAEDRKDISSLIELMKKHSDYESFKDDSKSTDLEELNRGFYVYNSALALYEKSGFQQSTAWNSLLNCVCSGDCLCDVYVFQMLAFFVRFHPDMPGEIYKMMNEIYELDNYHVCRRKHILKPLYDSLESYREIYVTDAERKRLEMLQKQYKKQFRKSFQEIYKNGSGIPELEKLFATQIFNEIKFDSEVIAELNAIFSRFENDVANDLCTIVYHAYKLNSDKQNVQELLASINNYQKQYRPVTEMQVG